HDYFTPDLTTERVNVALNDLIERTSAAKAELPRPYLGASIAGSECLRRVQYDWWCTPLHSPRTREIFARGHYFEEHMLTELYAAGFKFAFRSAAAPSTATAAASSPGAADQATLPDELLKDIREGGVGKKNDKSRSALFQSVVDQLKRRHWSIEAIIELFERYPNGVAAKYKKRLRNEVERSYGKASAGPTASAAAPSSGSAPTPGAAPTAQPSAAPSPAHTLPTIRLVNGQLPRAVAETERALLSASTAIFSRAGTLVYPVAETMTAADGRKTIMARLSPF